MKLQLKTIRKRKKITQKELAASLSVDLKTVGNWERGETMMSIEQLCNCCVALGCTPNDMTGWYIDHPEDMPSPLDTRAGDPRRSAMVEAYDTLTDDGKTLASEMVASVARDPLRRADAAGSGSAGLRSAETGEKVSA